MKKKNWKDSMFLPSHVEIPSPQHSSTLREEEEVAMRQKQQFCMDSNSLSVVSLGSSIKSENATHISNSNRLRRSLSLSAIVIHHSFERSNHDNDDDNDDEDQTYSKRFYDLRPRK